MSGVEWSSDFVAGCPKGEVRRYKLVPMDAPDEWTPDPRTLEWAAEQTADVWPDTLGQWTSAQAVAASVMKGYLRGALIRLKDRS